VFSYQWTRGISVVRFWVDPEMWFRGLDPARGMNSVILPSFMKCCVCAEHHSKFVTKISRLCISRTFIHLFVISLATMSTTETEYTTRSLDSSVNTVTKPWAGRSGFRIPAEARDLSLLHNFHIDSVANPLSTGVLSRDKAAGAWD
jgi:hypothetical protein